MSKFESNNTDNTGTVGTPSNISLVLTDFAENVNMISSIGNSGLTIELTLAKGHIEREIAEAQSNGYFYWTEPMSSITHIVELYAKRHIAEVIDGLHWNQRSPDTVENDINRLYSHKKHLIPKDVREIIFEIQRLKKERTTNRQRDLELIAYLKLAKKLDIKTGLTKEQEALLNTTGEEIDEIVLGLREDLMILEVKLAV